MNRFLSTAALGAAIALAGCADVGDAPEAETTAVDPDATTQEFTGTALPVASSDSTVAWTAAKVTGRHVGGFGDVTGSVYVDGETVTGAEIAIDARSVYSDNEQLTGHLMSEDFFAVETYPEASFRTTELSPIATADSVEWAEATHNVTGVLTMHGQSNQITFPAKITVDGGMASVTADFNINRKDWGIVYEGKPDDLIQDQVNIRLNVSTAGAQGVAEETMAMDAAETDAAE